MKKLTLMLASVAALTTVGKASAGDMAFQQGTNTIGVGLNLPYGSGVGFAAAWDHGAINNMFSFGAEVNMSFYHEDVQYLGWKQEWGHTYMAPEFRFGFHPFGLPALEGKVSVADKLDPYVVAHAGISFDIWSWEVSGEYVGDKNKDNDMDVDPTFGIATGVRWMFKPNFGLWGEVDWNRFIVGAAFKF